MQLRHIRGDRELPALVDDANYDVNYQEYRQFQKPVNVLPVSTFHGRRGRRSCLAQPFSFFARWRGTKAAAGCL